MFLSLLSLAIEGFLSLLPEKSIQKNNFYQAWQITDENFYNSICIFKELYMFFSFVD